MINLELTKTKLTVEITGFVFFLFELYSFFALPAKDLNIFLTPEIIFLKTVILLIAFPVLYLFRFSHLLGLGDAFSWFLASLNAKPDEPIVSAGAEATYFGIAIIINFLLGILLIFRVINIAYSII